MASSSLLLHISEPKIARQRPTSVNDEIVYINKKKLSQVAGKLFTQHSNTSVQELNKKIKWNHWEWGLWTIKSLLKVPNFVLQMPTQTQSQNALTALAPVSMS